MQETISNTLVKRTIHTRIRQIENQQTKCLAYM